MRRACLMLAVALGVAGCSSMGETMGKLNPFSARPDPKSKPAELTSFTASVQVRTQWQASIGSSAEYTLTPAIVQDRVYVAARNGALAALENGKEVWKVNVGQPIAGGVGADGNLVAVGTAKGEVLVFNAADGAAKWQARASSEILAAPSLGEGLVIVRSGDARVFAFDQADGKRRWVYQRSNPALTLRSNVGVLLAGRGIMAGFPGGKLVAISTANGAALWELSIALPKGSTELERMADITSEPIMDGRSTCAVAYQGRVACIDMQTGSTQWAREVSSSAGLDVDSRAVYVSDDKGTVHAFDRQTGSSLWKQSALSNRVLSRPISLGGYVAVGDGQGYIHIMRREDGAFAGRMSTDGSAIEADPKSYGRGFLVQTKNGGVYALSLE